MEREILTQLITRAQMQEELSFSVQYFLEKGVENCKVLFGYCWGNDYYPGNEWWYEEIALSHLVAKVSEVEASGIGAIGQDDLWVRISGLEFRFCNDSDIHIKFAEPSDDIEFFYSRWKNLGYRPSEWVRNQELGPGDRVRFD